MMQLLERESWAAQLVEQLTGAELDTQLHSISLHCRLSEFQCLDCTAGYPFCFQNSLSVDTGCIV